MIRLKSRKLKYVCYMESRFKIIGAILLTTLYCFAVNAVIYSSVGSDYDGTYRTEQEQYKTPLSQSLIFHTTSSGDSVNSFHNFSGLDFRNPLNIFQPLIHSAGALSDAEFTQYNQFSVNFPIRFRKADLIFPFHYFW